MTPDRPDASTPVAPRYALGWAMLVCAIAALTLAHPALTGGFLVNPRSDQFIAGYAFRDYAAQMLRTQGHFPLWNPYLFGGLPYVDAMHGDIFYPTFLLRMLFPTDVAMTWGMILHLWLAGVAAYALFRAHGLAFHASLVGGLAYMMSGMIAGLVAPGHDGKIFVSALFPLALLVLRSGIRGGKRWAWGALALVVGLGVLSPHPQLLQYMLLCSGAYALWMVFAEGGDGAPPRPIALRRLGLAFGAVLIGFAIGAIQFLPVLHYVGWSPRAGGAGWEHAISYSMPPEELVNTFLPQFSGILDSYWGRNGIHFHSEYLGVVVILLATAAFGSRLPAMRRAVWFWAGMLLVTGFWALGGYTPFYHVVYAIIPGTKYFRAPSTIMFASALAVAALAAIGASRVLAGELGKRYLVGAAIALAAVTLLGVSGALSGMFSNLVSESRFSAFNANRGAVVIGAVRMFVFAGGALVLMYGTSRRMIPRTAAAWLFAGLVVADLWSVERQYWMFSPPAAQLFATDAAIERIKSDSVPGRVLAIGTKPTRDPNLNYDGLMVHGVRTVCGYHGNELGRYQLLTESCFGQLLGSPTFWQLMNVQWIYTDADSLPLPEFERVVGPVRDSFGSSVSLFRFKGENSLAWVVPAVMKVPDDVTLKTIGMPGYPIRSVALFDTSASVAGEQLTAAPPPLAIRARVTKWAPGAIDIELDQPAPARSALLVSENFYPGWRAVVDGQPATAERADYTIIGVPLKAGARKVELRFTSDPFERGKLITILALLLSVVLAFGGVILDRRVTRA